MQAPTVNVVDAGVVDSVAPSARAPAILREARCFAWREPAAEVGRCLLAADICSATGAPSQR